MAALTAAARKKIPKSEFALPEKDGYPVDTPGRARSALSRGAQFASPGEQARIRAKVARDYPGIKQSKGRQAKKTGNSSNSNGRIAREVGRRLEARDKPAGGWR